jgi:UPF0755 protein
LAAKKSNNRENQGSENRLRSREQARRRTLWRRVLLFVGLPFAVASALIYTQCRPVPTPAAPIRLRVRGHSGLFAIGKTLQENGVVRSGMAFAVAARFSGKASELKAGNYKFSGDLTLEHVIERMAQGPNDSAADRLHVTIPEGFTVDQIAKTLEARGVVNAKEFLEFVTNPNAYEVLPSDFPLPKHSLEGCLFPDTYDFLPRQTPMQVAAAMLNNFSRRFYRDNKAAVDAAHGGLEAVVIKASLIEKEARIDPDRPRIAGVIENRLAKGMKLQIDATVLYGRSHKTRIMDGDLKRESPYNTYLHDGLPIGAIGCPGLPSLNAALHPDTNNYLYYVARPTGAHIFSATFAEHQAAIARARAEEKQRTRRTRTDTAD